MANTKDTDMTVIKTLQSKSKHAVQWLKNLAAGSEVQLADADDPSQLPKRRVALALVAAVVVLAVVVGGGVLLYTRSTRDVKPAPKQGARGYTLTPPDGWKRLNPAPAGTSVAFEAPTADKDDTGTLQAFIVVESAPLNQQAERAAFTDIAKAYVSQLSQSYANYKMINTSSKVVAGNPVVLVTFTFGSNNTEVTGESLFTVKKGISYTVNGEALSSAWPSYSSAIENALLSFRP